MRSTIISLGLFNHTGGTVKTIVDFKRSLNAQLYAFCEKSSLGKHELSVEGARSVVSSSLPILSKFCYSRKGTKEAELAVQESDIVSCHSFYRYHALWTHKICKTSDIPYFFIPHGILDPWVMRKNRFVKQSYCKLGGQRFLEDASTVIFSTSAERDKAVSQFELPGSEVLPWAVELINIDNRESIRVRVRKKLGIPEKAHVLLYFGRVHPMKRPLETIEAVAKANSEEVHLMIVGNENGVTRANCMQLARRHGVEKRIHFIGPIYGEEKYNYMYTSDAYISLSHRENFNYTAAESLAAGLPVILSPGNDLRSELSGIGCCLEIEDNTLRSSVKAINAFNDLSLSKLQEKGMLGRKWVEENLNFDLFKTRLIELHQQYAKS
jgi:glycosyltransferase involved in cell wall biosynthesis